MCIAWTYRRFRTYMSLRFSHQGGKAQDFDGLGHDFNLACPVSVEQPPGPLTKNVDSLKNHHRHVRLKINLASGKS